jgi:Skp family chaperone for outer membrane proteins
MKSQLIGLLSLASLVLVSAAQSPAAPASPIRYVRSQAVFAEAKDARAEVEKFQELQRQKMGELRAKAQTLDALRSQIVAAPDAETRARLADDEKRQRAELEQATVATQTELQSRQRQMQAGLQARVKVVLDELLKGQDVVVVLNAETSIVWAQPGADLTAAVIAKLNGSGD